ncbi:ring finger protein-like [Tenrec ecaudatus]|uniref:ring finger protein-like n=1 Tax=Tenrec ecaudatus TaxID=94439 RepID=UPI003F595853
MLFACFALQKTQPLKQHGYSPAAGAWSLTKLARQALCGPQPAQGAGLCQPPPLGGASQHSAGKSCRGADPPHCLQILRVGCWLVGCSCHGNGTAPRLGLGPALVRDGLPLAQDLPGTGTGRQGPDKVSSKRGGDRPPTARSVPGARVEPRLRTDPEGDPDPHSPGHLAALGSQPPHTSTGPPSPPPTSLSPEWQDSPGQERADGGEGSAGPEAPLCASLLERQPLLGAAAAASAAEEAPGTEGEECPICTEPYAAVSERRLTLLNCGHGLCTGCLGRLLSAVPSADLGRVRCPLCRQKTPMLEWAICQLQEELLQADGPQRPAPATPPQPPGRGRGFWAALEHRYQLRFLAGPVGGHGCLPCLPCPPRLGARLWALRDRGACARRLALLSLLALELLGLLLVFTPLLLLALLFVLLERASR